MTSGLTPFEDGTDASFPAPRRSGALAWTSVGLSAALLAMSLTVVDGTEVLARLETTEPRWLMAFFAVYAVQLLAFGARWSAIARMLGVPLTLRRASAEYSLSLLVNQLLPTGFAGDGLRAYRHARRSGSRFSKVLEALALDRLSGQLGLALIVLLSCPLTPRVRVVEPRSVLIGFCSVVGIAVLLWLSSRLSPRWRRFLSPAGAFVARAGRVLLSPRHMLVHLPLSVLLVGTLLLQLDFAARAIGVTLDPYTLLWAGPLILVAASVPSFFGGWGIREGASALLFATAGMSASEGVAVSVVFGAFVLMCALPGSIVLLFEGQLSDGAGPGAPLERDTNGRRAEPYDAWSHAHAVGMLIGTVLALTFRLPLLLSFAVALSLLFLIAQSWNRWTPSGHFGAANTVTALRFFLTVVMSATALGGAREWLAATAVLILLLDVVDGWLARRNGSAGPFGACFDVEVDAVFILTLSFTLLALDVAGPWVLCAGLWRYLYVLAPLVFPTQVADVPRSSFNRIAYVAMVASFVLALLVPPAWGAALALLGTLVVSVSFVRSFWLRYAPRVTP